MCFMFCREKRTIKLISKSDSFVACSCILPYHTSRRVVFADNNVISAVKLFNDVH